MGVDEEANTLIDQLMNSGEYKQRLQQFEDYINFVYNFCHGSTNGDDEDEEEENEADHVIRYSSRDDILRGLKDILRTIPRDNMKKSMEHLQILDGCYITWILVSLLRSPVKENKEIAKECIRLFLIDPKTNSGFFLPRSIQNQCVTIVLSFCEFFRGATDDDGCQLYYSCRETLVSILKSIAFSNRPKYFGIARTSQLIYGLHRFLSEAERKLYGCLKSTYLSQPSLVTSDLRSLKSYFDEFALFSLHVRSAIQDHVRQCLDWLCTSIRDAGSSLKFNFGWSYLLSILKELNNISELYEDGEELLSAAFQDFPLAMNYLIRHSKRSDDHLWLLKYGNAMDFESRIHLIVMMFPEVKDDEEKLHKILIDRSLLLPESFEHIALVKARSLHNGLFVEFKDEVATGHGVLREWLSLVCQALFSPQESLFVECPEDRRRFFPSPVEGKPQQLKYFGFCGRVVALALKHRVQVGIAFDSVFFLQLANEKTYLEDIRCQIQSYAMGLTFVREIKEFGSRKTVELCPGGNNIVVNSKNREQYVHLLIQHLFVRSISAKVAYFARGFGDILCKRRLAKNFFHGIDLKGLNCVLLGSDKPICLKDLKAHTKYEDFKETDEQICWFWKVVEVMSMEQQRELLFFWTSVKYLPVNGFSGLPYPLTIYKTCGSDDRLPSSHTCFYRLSLPCYPSMPIIQQHLSFICQAHIGCSFGFM
ncbi:hypothetical protein MKW98_017779 [Papaver atlanticum]|uniref:HECT-type E3 ubiquitin transferase n=1 Tax=Papaver atlanticum TaxID=357466 RepID=A0AAD4TEX7_9MAGN|nr:hypothetical protein MKW98_017779 [Papaver atlanticum]